MKIKIQNKLIKKDSPCKGICSNLFDDVCRGCGRTNLEISNWVCLSKLEKEKIWKRIIDQGYIKIDF
ncbi:hypothetical protein CKSOR_00647 [Candidatus Kinetoplastibacterium sorsogonicusi]|uniref:DUF1289 domain-containing protein n=1 Tax=Candidatus Kinetoplastidibacterium kentomonadis TaxID=1576550 RepID=A0A3Q8ERP9_9PROT|nr:DUF1289 domain-containing protein [Candidatus Kinetoplastibacterium sorsogonicusi]AWD32748.1 hypothetical protein CKSOR_00647 [Candidatus Kinetoplastibacterium sorsogonicusi]